MFTKKITQQPYVLALLISLFLSICLFACSPQSTPQNQSSSGIEDEGSSQISYQTIQIPGPEGMTIQLPEGWEHYGQSTNWSPDDGKTLIGFHMGWKESGKEVEAGLLPPNSNVTSSKTLKLNGLNVQQIYLDLYAPQDQGTEKQSNVIAKEINYICTSPDNKMVIDFYCRADSQEEINLLVPVMENLISTYTIQLEE